LSHSFHEVWFPAWSSLTSSRIPADPDAKAGKEPAPVDFGFNQRHTDAQLQEERTYRNEGRVLIKMRHLGLVIQSNRLMRTSETDSGSKSFRTVITVTAVAVKDGLTSLLEILYCIASSHQKH
jgi:hypothetical protein